VFTEDRKHAQISPVMELDARDPTVLEALLYWTRWVACEAARRRHVS
jgi:hypothetical protein